VKVPTYKWVVEDVCDECSRNCNCSECTVNDAGPKLEAAKK
jgi:hypothetical protein